MVVSKVDDRPIKTVTKDVLKEYNLVNDDHRTVLTFDGLDS